MSGKIELIYLDITGWKFRVLKTKYDINPEEVINKLGTNVAKYTLELTNPFE